MIRILYLFKQNILARIAIYIAIISFATFIFAIINISRDAKEIQNKLATLNAKQNIQLNFEKVLEFYQRQYEELSTSLAQHRPKVSEIANLLETIDQKSHETGLIITTKNLPFTNLTTPKVRYEIAFEGTKMQMDQFLNNLFDIPTYIEIQTININQIKDFQIDTLAKYNITIDIFIRK